MKIWEMSSDANNYDNFTLCNKSDWDRLLAYGFDGKSIKCTWTVFRVEELESIRKGDMPCLFGSIPVFSFRAVEGLREYLDNSAEILPISYDKGEYFIINVTNVIDCVDYEKAEVKRFKSSGKIMRFIKYAFKHEAIKNEHIFKISEFSKSAVFVSDDFKNDILNHGLEGFLFSEVWDSEVD